jgi:hypothetical protein
MTYAGTARGRTRAHSSTKHPGKRYVTISQASPAPTSSVPAPTPATSASVLPISSESCVRQRCDQISWAG